MARSRGSGSDWLRVASRYSNHASASSISRSSSASRIATTVFTSGRDWPDRRSGLGRTPDGRLLPWVSRPCQAFSLTTSARAPHHLGSPARAPTKEFLLALVPFPEEEV